MPRNLRLEYKNYQGTPEQIKRRASRNKARRIAEKLGIVQPGDGRDVGHENGNPFDNRPKNLRAESKHGNRSYPRTPSARKRNPRD